MRSAAYASAALATALLAGSARARQPADAAAAYLVDVKPLLAARCYACHGAIRQNAGLRLDTAGSIRQGGDSGPAVVPGDAAASLLIERVSGDESFRMPPEAEGERLDAEEIALLRAWIDAGAAGPADEAPQTNPADHWSYRPPARPPLPQVGPPVGQQVGSQGPQDVPQVAAGWVRNPIDAFIAREHQRRGLAPVPEADRATLLRRVYFDLVGLPPSRDALRAFLADTSQGAYERVVDRLLASPQYGERWGRHWMDVWRYSDWYGRRDEGEIRYSQRHIWRWRDWIIASLNQDRGYDRMLLEMLAGDELAPEDPQALAATGFLARNWYKFNRNAWLQETVEHTATGLLAVTLRCARCHDHKYEPLAQQDYYRFRAFFEPHGVRTDRLAGQPDVLVDGLPRVYDATLDAPTYLFARGDERSPQTDRPLAPGVPAALWGGVELAIHPVSLPLASYAPGVLPFVAEELLEEGRAKVAAVQAELAAADDAARPLHAARLEAACAELAAREARLAADQARLGSPPREDAAPLAQAAARAQRAAAMAVAQYEVVAAEMAVAQAQAAAEAAAAGSPEAAKETATALADAQAKLDAARSALDAAHAAAEGAAQDDAKYTPLGPEYPATSTGRRLALARWIVDPANPRTARVAVNHIWLRHFGRALVPSVANFGLGGKDPSHPELLDWLAVELVEGGWRMKRLHRMIVTSSAYRMRSSAGEESAANAAIDPDNRYLWRMGPRRLEAEAVRDALLCLAGSLDMAAGGPELAEDLALATHRRSVYYRLTPDSKVEMLELFDQANPNQCYERTVSVVPQQALVLANSGLALSQARLIARRLAAAEGDGDAGDEAAARSDEALGQRDEAFVVAVFETVLCRRPSHTELAACLRFLADQAALLADTSALAAFPSADEVAVPPSPDPRLRAREGLVHVLLNHNDFVTVR